MQPIPANDKAPSVTPRVDLEDRVHTDGRGTRVLSQANPLWPRIMEGVWVFQARLSVFLPHYGFD